MIDESCYVFSPRWLSEGAGAQNVACPQGFSPRCPSLGFLGRAIRGDPLLSGAGRVRKHSTPPPGTQRLFARTNKSRRSWSSARALLCSKEGCSCRRWRPAFGHSTARALFVPTVAALLGVDKSYKDCLGGWTLAGSDLYVRTAVKRIRVVPDPSRGAHSWRGCLRSNR